ncbi:O-antigen ligase domain-containing protein [Ruminococcus sp. AM28-41]|nr:O-antigen ligase domain-containing protein [Ruminococcus sp. AM28-41]
MTLFSVLLIAIIFFQLRKQKTLSDYFIKITAMAVSLEMMMAIGYFLRIGAVEIGYSEFIIILDTILCILLLSKKKIRKSAFILGLLFILSCFISLLLQFIFPYDGKVVSSSAAWDFYYFQGQLPDNISIGLQNIKELLHVFCYVIIIIQANSLSDEKKKLMIKNVFENSKYFIWFGIIEFVLIKILHVQTILTSIELFIFGDSYISDGAMLSIGVSDRLRGLKPEPSMYGFSLFLFFSLSYFLYKQTNIKRYKKYSIITILLMVLSLSFTSLVCLFGIFVYWLVLKYKEGKRKNKHAIVLLACICILALILFLKYMYLHEFSQYYLKRIHMALINFDDLSINGWHGDYATYDGSTKIRLISIIGTLKYFIKRPLFGLALGSTYAHSTFATVLASIGLVGVILWWKFTFEGNGEKKGNIFVLSTIIWCALLLIMGSGLFPFYGVENIVVVYIFDNFASTRKKRNEYESQNINYNSLL